MHYKNGLRRALGECRLGVDQVEEYERPAYICFNLAQDQGLQVVCTTTGAIHHHNSVGWTCCQMRGSMEWSVEKRITQLVQKME